MNEEQNGFLDLCRTIIDKGTINENDIRQISEYINTFPNIADRWPADLLIESLQNIWDDGVIDDSELKSFAQLLTNTVRPNTTESQHRIPPVIDSSNNLTKAKSQTSISSDPLAKLIEDHKVIQQEALSKVKEAFKALNKRNATTEELEEADGLIYDAAEAISDLSEQCEERSTISEFVDERVEELCGGEDNDEPSWNDYFEKKPSKGLVKKCAIQAIIEAKDLESAMDLTFDLIRSELILK